MRFLRVLALGACLAALPSLIWAGADSPHQRVAELEESVTLLSTAIDGVLADTLPEGTVVAWSGLPGFLPEGWALCDGLEGRPDLHDRFIMGAAGPEDLGEEGGTTEHQHLVQPHQHEFPVPHHVHEIPGLTGLVTTEAGEHTHVMGDSTASVLVDTVNINMGEDRIVGAHPHTHQVLAAGLHNHDLELPGQFTGVGEGTAETSYAESAAGGAEHLPPYYKLAFIVKLGEDPPPAEEPSGSSAGNPNQRISALEESVAVLSSAVEEAMLYRVPETLTVMWSGSPEQVPFGWALCDGTYGTPDLREKFVRGAAGGEEIGEEGGSAEHTHEVGAHQHEVSMPAHVHDIPEQIVATDSIGDHTHELNTFISAEFVSDFPEIDPVCRSEHSHTISAAGAHSHTVTIPARTTLEDEGSSNTPLGASTLDPAGNLPPYYKLAYIMKLGRTTPSAKDAPDSSSLSLHERIEALEEAVFKLEAALSPRLPFLVPPEAIAAWTESLGLLPEGWVFCDGENGTPDLRDMFIMGAVVGAGEQGGAPAHGHSFEPHDHTAYFPHTHESNPRPARTDTSLPDERTGHSHDATGPTETIKADGGGLSHAWAAFLFHNHMPYFDGSTVHEHDLTVDPLVAPVGSELHAETTDQTSAVTDAEHLPPYYTAAFVMKLVE